MLKSTLPVGFLAQPSQDSRDLIVSQFIEKLRTLEQMKWKDVNDENLIKVLNIYECVDKIIDHHAKVIFIRIVIAHV
jgi:hypothetical protein